ncbi:hypothetical protein [Spirosoma fluminis]
MKLRVYPVLVTLLLVSGIACEHPAGTDGQVNSPHVTFLTTSY